MVRWKANSDGGKQHVADMRGLAAAQAARGEPQSFPMQHKALLFARTATVEINLDNRPELERALLFGPFSLASLLIDGPDRLPDAAQRTLAAAEAFGQFTTTDYTPTNAPCETFCASVRQSPETAVHRPQRLRDIRSDPRSDQQGRAEPSVRLPSR